MIKAIKLGIAGDFVSWPKILFVRGKMSLPEEISAPETADQIVEWIAGLSDTELTDGLTRHELSVGGTRSE